MGRDSPDQAEPAELPPRKAGGVIPAPSMEKLAPYGSKRTGLAPGPGAPLAFTANLFSSDLGHPPVTEGLHTLENSVDTQHTILYIQTIPK